MPEVVLTNAKQADEFLTAYKQREEGDHYFFFVFYRSDCPYTAPTKKALRLLQEHFDKPDSNVEWITVMNQAIHVIRKYLGIPVQYMATVPAAIVVHKKVWRSFLARHMDFHVQLAHFNSIKKQIRDEYSNWMVSAERRGGSEKGRRKTTRRKEKEKGPVFFTYYFHRSMRHDPVHMTIVGALILLNRVRKMPTMYRPVNDLHMHGVLSVHGGINRTYKGHAAASYLARLLEANERFGLLQSRSSQERRGGGGNGGATWADYLTGFTITAALLAGL